MLSPFGRSMPSWKINLICAVYGWCCCQSTVLSHRPWCHPESGRRSWNVQLRETRTIGFECCGGVCWNVPIVAFHSLQCTGNCSDDKKCNTQHSQTDRWSGHGCCVRSLAFVEKSEELCACTSGVEAIGRAMCPHQWSVQGYHRCFACADMISAGVWGKSCVPRDRRTRCWNCQARFVWCWHWMVSQTNRLIVGQTYELTDSKSVWQSTWLTHL